MFTNRELTRLGARKAGLLAQSAANRNGMSDAAAQLRREAAWVEAGYLFYKQARAAGSIAAPAVGVFTAIRGHGIAAWISRIGSAVKLCRHLKAMWTAAKAAENADRGSGI